MSQISSLDHDDQCRSGADEKRDASSDDTMDVDHYSANTAHSSGRNSASGHHDADDEDYDSSSDSDGGLVMSRRKSIARPNGGMAAALEASAAAAAAAASSHRSGDGSPTPRKSTRSGSNHTMKKVRTRDSIDDRRFDSRSPGSPDIHEE